MFSLKKPKSFVGLLSKTVVIFNCVFFIRVHVNTIASTNYLWVCNESQIQLLTCFICSCYLAKVGLNSSEDLNNFFQKIAVSVHEMQVLSKLTVCRSKDNAFYTRHEGDINVLNLKPYLKVWLVRLWFFCAKYCYL